MAKYSILILMLAAVFSFTACESETAEGGVNAPANLISFDIVGDEPIVAAPDEEVSYTFTVIYSGGLTSIVTALDGEVIEGSKKTWDNAPVEVEYSFTYLVKASQFGQTLDFVFTAIGVDGYVQSIDYPLWVSANNTEFLVVLSDNSPSEIYNNETVNFEVNVSCGNVLKSLVVDKDGLTWDSKSDFTTEKTFAYEFSYTPSTDDVNKDVEFHFVATDVKGNVSEAYYSVRVVKADVVGKELFSETFNTSMSISGTTELDTSVGGVTGGKATQFITSTIGTYNTLYVENPDDPQADPVLKQGAMEGCKVYDNDLSVIKYSSDGVDVCLSKFTDANRQYVSGAHLWYRKAKNGWFRVDGIKLHGATSLKLSYSQSIDNSKAKVEYSVDGGMTWVELMATDTQNDAHDKKFTVPEGTETISLKFIENGGTVHVCLDNIKLVEIL